MDQPPIHVRHRVWGLISYIEVTHFLRTKLEAEESVKSRRIIIRFISPSQLCGSFEKIMGQKLILPHCGK
jgi:hypothetical protein